MITSWSESSVLWLLTDAVVSESQVRAAAEQTAAKVGRRVDSLYLYSTTKRGRKREYRWTAWCPLSSAG